MQLIDCSYWNTTSSTNPRILNQLMGTLNFQDLLKEQKSTFTQLHPSVFRSRKRLLICITPLALSTQWNPNQTCHLYWNLSYYWAIRNHCLLGRRRFYNFEKLKCVTKIQEVRISPLHADGLGAKTNYKREKKELSPFNCIFMAISVLCAMLVWCKMISYIASTHGVKFRIGKGSGTETKLLLSIAFSPHLFFLWSPWRINLSGSFAIRKNHLWKQRQWSSQLKRSAAIGLVKEWRTLEAFIRRLTLDSQLDLLHW